MSWEKFSTTPLGWGVAGGSASLTAGQRSQLVRIETAGPQVWCVRCVADAPCDFVFTVGNGQSSQQFTHRVASSQFVALVATTLDVDAVAPGTVNCSASAAADTGPSRAPDVASAQTFALVAGIAQTIPASGRAFALIHNNTGAAMQVRIGGLDVQQIANQATFNFQYAGAFDIYSTGGGAVNVAEFWL